MARPRRIDILLEKDKKLRVEDILNKYNVTAETNWSIIQFSFGRVAQEFIDLDYEECKALFLNLDKNHDLSTRVYADEQKLLIYEAWELFRTRRSAWAADML